MKQRENLYQLFPTCLYVADVAESKALNAGLLPEIYKLRSEDEKSNLSAELKSVFDNEVWTSYFSRKGEGLIRMPWTFELQKAALFHVARFVDLLKYDFGNCKPKITTLFANIHSEPWHRHDAHTHPGSMFSGSYYVKTYAGAGRLRLVNPAKVLKFHEYSTKDQSELNVDDVSLDPVEGRVVIFHSHVPHAVDRPTVAGDRVAISFNVNYF
jgi:uncharacterized protein (TIGR02466 family)